MLRSEQFVALVRPIRLESRNLWRRQAREADLDAELQFHIETEAEEQIAAGLPADRARQAARRSLGNVTLTKEDARAVWTWGARSSASSRMCATPSGCLAGNGRSPRPRSPPSS
jgi:hypothetical protein